jgi:pilus assembly protein CpaD
MRKASLLTILLLSACGSVTNGPRDALTVAQRHPITVDKQTVTLSVSAEGNPNGLSRASLAEIDAFVNAYRTRGHGPITVTAPSGNGRDVYGQQTAADVRAALFASGIPYEAMQGATISAGRGADEVILSFASYVATGPSCGRYPGELANQRANRMSTNFGCATQANLAAMIADPRDLTSPATHDGMGDPALARRVGDLDGADNSVAQTAVGEADRGGE